MVNKEKIELNIMKYYTPSWSTSIKIMILKVLDNNLLLVKGSKKQTFIRHIEFVFNKAEHANRSCKDWESRHRRSKKKKKKS